MKKNPLFYTGIILLLLSWLFVGVRFDREFDEPHLLLKYRPSLQWNFHPGIGMDDLTVAELPLQKQQQEMAYLEFHTHSPMRHTIIGKYLPNVLLLATFLCLTLGVWKVISRALTPPNRR